MARIYTDGRFAGAKNPNFGKGEGTKAAWKRGAYFGINRPSYTRGKGGRYKGVWMRSSWEIEYAHHLDEQKIEWKYEPKQFPLVTGGYYRPDFYLPATDEYIEIKGFWWPRARAKFDRFLVDYPEIKISVIEDRSWKN